jgi:hypothetical protein
MHVITTNLATQDNSSKTQRSRILRLFIEARGEWVPLPDILTLGIAQYGARILELRRTGFSIENRTERRDGTRHSWFRLIASPNAESQPKLRVLEPTNPDYEWKESARTTGLPLFDLAVRG